MDARNPQTAEQDHPLSSVLWRAVTRQALSDSTLVDEIYESLWKQIVEGERQPGERLSDVTLAAEFGVSRTPVRQALHQLQRGGLVQATPSRGFHVSIYSADDIRELYDLRTILEVAAVRLATERLDEAAIRAALEEVSVLRGIAEAQAGPAFLRSDVRLHHQLIAVGSGNQRLAEAIGQQRAQLGIFLVGGTRLPQWIASALDEHELLLQAMLERNVDQAAQAMERHIQTVKQSVLREFAMTRTPRVRSFHTSRSKRHVDSLEQKP